MAEWFLLSSFLLIPTPFLLTQSMYQANCFPAPAVPEAGRRWPCHYAAEWAEAGRVDGAGLTTSPGKAPFTAWEQRTLQV